MPKNGKILTYEDDGSQKELQVGDIISTETMKNFSYNQGAEFCSSDNTEKCKDSFVYTTMGSWVGEGVEKETQIKLTPVII